MFDKVGSVFGEILYTTPMDVMVAPPLFTILPVNCTEKGCPEMVSVYEVELTVGIVAGVTGSDATEEDPVPTELIALTVNVYGVPFVRPVTIPVVTLPTVTGEFPADGLDVRIYPVIGDPPFDKGASQETVTCVFPATPTTFVGAPGTVGGIEVAEGTLSRGP
jgi:hypothetical protein